MEELAELQEEIDVSSFENLRARELVEQAFRLLRPVADRRNISLLLEGPGISGTIWATPGLLLRAILNLLDNALRHSPAGASISVVLEGDADLLASICIRNALAPSETGATGEASTAIDSPSRLHETRTGLGLLIVRRIAELHGGRFLIDGSEAGVMSARLSLPKDSTPFFQRRLQSLRQP